MLQSEMLIQEVVKACASFVSTDGSHLLHLCFDNITEYDPDVVFDKKLDFLSFAFLCNLPTFFHTLGVHSPSPPPPSGQAWC